jgi:hypothetical protein
MKSGVKHLVKVAAAGFIVLTLLSVSLFWCRWACETIRISQLGSTESLAIQPSGLVPDEYEDANDVVQHSRIQAPATIDDISYSLGIWDYFVESNSNIYGYRNKAGEWTGSYFDNATGQIFYRYKISDSLETTKILELCAGPEGVSDKPDNKMGRFNSPIVDEVGIYSSLMTLYDTRLHRFFKIDFNKRTVLKGPELSKDKQYNPVAIYPAHREINLIYLNWLPPMIRDVQQTDTKEGQSLSNKLTSRINNYDFTSPYIPVLDESGRIDLLDKTTLEFVGTAGDLPNPPELYPLGRYVTTKDVFAYRMLPLVLNTDNRYRGLFVATINREATALTLAVFDPSGHIIKAAMSQNSPKKAYLGLPWLPTLTIAKYLLENLHPPILSIASFITADTIDARAGYRGIFLLPNSFVAMRARGDIGGFAGKLSQALLLFMLPAIILAILLAWRVNKDAMKVGLSPNTRILWTLGVVAFGLAGYITYRLCRPGITLVTCANCGKMRRPDMEKCHRCNSGWSVPELISPSWRVIN